MAANLEQGVYWIAFLIGLSVLPAGWMALSSRPIIGVVLALSGQALVIRSLAGLYRVKGLESGNR